MKKIILMIFTSFILLSSCNMKYETENRSETEKKAIITDHAWKGLHLTIYINNSESGKQSLNNLVYAFDSNGNFEISDQTGIIKHGDWQLLNISGEPVLRMTFYISETDHEINDYEISILTNDYLQLSEYSNLNPDTIIQKDYFLIK